MTKIELKFNFGQEPAPTTMPILKAHSTPIDSLPLAASNLDLNASF